MTVMTRRTLLAAGTVATAGAGAVVVGETHRGRRWLHSAGIIDGPDKQPPDVAVTVEEATLDSRHMGGPVAWAFAFPPASPPGGLEAAVVCLHGRGGSRRLAFDSVGVHRFVAGAGLPWVVVGVDGGASSYWHRRADSTDSGAMVVDELLPELRRRFGTTPVFLLGWSMGGYGALLLGADHGDAIRAVVASSPAVWRTFRDAAPGSFDSAEDFRKHDLFDRVQQLDALRVRIDCGDDDPFAGTARAFADRLPRAEKHFGAGFHDAGFWRSRVPDQLEFLRAALKT